MSQKIIEWAPFVLKDNLKIDDLCGAADLVQSQFISRQKGFISRDLVQSEGVYADIIYWESQEDATQAGNLVESCSACKEYFEFMDPAKSVHSFTHFKILRSYGA